MTTPPNDRNPPRITTGREELVRRTASEARLGINVRRDRSEDRLLEAIPEGTGPNQGPGRGELIAANVRQCWICFLTEEDDRTMKWIKPCVCRGTMKWVHESCLQQWIDRRHNEDNKMLPPFCPHCRTKYLVYYPRSGFLTRFLDFIDRTIEGTCPYIVGTVVAGSVYWTALCVGATAFLEAGDTDAKDILENGRPLILMLSLPIIPAVVIGLGMLKWEDMTLEFLRTVTDYVPLTGYILPTRVPNVSGIYHNRQISDGMACTRVFAGASLLPLASKVSGDLLYSSVPSPFLRSFYGCLTFIGVKGLFVMFHKQQTYKRIAQRVILDRPHNPPTTTATR